MKIKAPHVDKNCGACDCADPTAFVGLAADCDCGCHKRQIRRRVSERQYVERGGSICPFCVVGDISGGPVEIEGACATQEITCAHCGESWRDWYELRGYTVIPRAKEARP